MVETIPRMTRKRISQDDKHLSPRDDKEILRQHPAPRMTKREGQDSTKYSDYKEKGAR